MKVVVIDDLAGKYDFELWAYLECNVTKIIWRRVRVWRRSAPRRFNGIVLELQASSGGRVGFHS